MASFDDYDTAFRVRNLVKQTAKNEIDKQRPAPRYAIVKTIDKEDRSVGVVFVGDDEDNIVRVPYNSVAPSAIGQAVKIGGPANDRVVEDTRGPDESEARIEALESLVAHLSKKAYANSEPTADFSLTTTPSILPFNVPTGLEPLNVSTEPTGAHEISISGDYQYWCTMSIDDYRNNVTRIWVAVLPISDGIQFDIQFLRQGILIGSGEYTTDTPYTAIGMIHLNEGDKIYVNGSNDSGTSTVFKAGARFGIKLENPDPIVRE